uniref:Uncharacterized protein n=1 Tax=Chromera velia CCMP2878 TaxID=1169474 RepID=A0A0G4IEU1_9ALVE|eukprot:Cvel_13832.t1-p1 / transcript=Cvel_13832.t1 / gene=Cvel_13832 / organism=Chromera_velia_CCMP2878 / gene_product=hypothetical protein / transcript_product=hypothetical protein / location=Cvel_scaffold960:39591-42303(+) / protein_length=215 / sequence_SO=supercontig / SO=protein_coding / is_pseudo=false
MFGDAVSASTRTTGGVFSVSSPRFGVSPSASSGQQVQIAADPQIKMEDINYNGISYELLATLAKTIGPVKKLRKGEESSDAFDLVSKREGRVEIERFDKGAVIVEADIEVPPPTEGGEERKGLIVRQSKGVWFPVQVVRQLKRRIEVMALKPNSSGMGWEKKSLMEVDDRKGDEILETFRFSEGMQISEDVIFHVWGGQKGSEDAFNSGRRGPRS